MDISYIFFLMLLFFRQFNDYRQISGAKEKGKKGSKYYITLTTAANAAC